MGWMVHGGAWHFPAPTHIGRFGTCRTSKAPLVDNWRLLNIEHKFVQRAVHATYLVALRGYIYSSLSTPWLLQPLTSSTNVCLTSCLRPRRRIISTTCVISQRYSKDCSWQTKITTKARTRLLSYGAMKFLESSTIDLSASKIVKSSRKWSMNNLKSNIK